MAALEALLKRQICCRPMHVFRCILKASSRKQFCLHYIRAFLRERNLMVTSEKNSGVWLLNSKFIMSLSIVFGIIN